MDFPIQGRQIEQPLIVFANQLMDYSHMSKRYIDGVVVRLAEKLDFFSKLGLEARVFAPMNGNGDDSYNIFNFSLDLERYRPNSIIRVRNGTKAHLTGMLWPRDAFQVLDGKLLVDVKSSIASQDLISGIISVNDSDYIETDLGIGGLYVKDGTTLIASDFIKNDPYIKELISQGYEVLFLPSRPDINETDDVSLRLRENNHIDTEFNFVSSPGGNYFAFVNGDYLEKYPDEVRTVVKALDAKLFTIPVESRQARFKAVNFISLGDGRIVVPEHCDAMTDQLIKWIGKKNVFVLPLETYDFSGDNGGIRCMSNVISYLDLEN
jgi:hypothetical protein